LLPQEGKLGEWSERVTSMFPLMRAAHDYVSPYNLIDEKATP
jgi:hypothetical protein